MRRRWKWLAAVVALVAALNLAVLLTLRSDWLKQKIRTAIVEQVEKASGGKAALALSVGEPCAALFCPVKTIINCILFYN